MSSWENRNPWDHTPQVWEFGLRFFRKQDDGAGWDPTRPSWSRQCCLVAWASRHFTRRTMHQLSTGSSTANSELIKEFFSRETQSRHILPTHHSAQSICGYAVRLSRKKAWRAHQRCFHWWLIVCLPSVIPKSSLDISLAELRGRVLQLPPAL